MTILVSLMFAAGVHLIWRSCWELAAGSAHGEPVGLWQQLRPRIEQRLTRRRRERLAAHWPDLVENMASAIRAGFSLPEAVSALVQAAPPALRPAFEAFDRRYRASGRFGEALDQLQADLSDPVADRVCATLRLAREVGGSDVGALLRTQAAFLRDDLRTREEVRARQSWTVYGARVAVAGPWLVLALLATRPSSLASFRTGTGHLVLLAGGLCTIGAYRWMVALARLPASPRILR